MIPKNTALLSLSLVLALLASCPAADWPVFRGDPALTGVAAGHLSPPLRLRWQFVTGDAVRSSPVIADGKVYIGSTDAKVYAIGLEDGGQQWRFDAGDALEAPPLRVGNLVVVGALNGTLYGLRANDGVPEWTLKTADRIMGAANTTKEKRLVFGSYDNKLRCVTEQGEAVWEYATENFINGTPAVLGGRVVFAGCDAKLHVLSAQDGTVLAEVELGSYVAASAALDGDRAYVGDYGGKLVAVDLRLQEILWEYSDEADAAPFFSSPAVGDKRVVVGSRDGRLHCVRATDGSLAWTVATGGDIDSSPVICDGKVVFGSRDGRLRIVKLTDGAKIWSYDVGSPITSSPAVSGGTVVIGAEDGNVYAFSPVQREPAGKQQ